MSLLGGLGGGFRDLGITFGLLDALDDTDGNGLSHVTDGESTKRLVVGESLDAHWLGWDQSDHGGISGLDHLGVLFQNLTRSTIDLLLHLGELAGNVSGVAIQHWLVSSVDLSRVVQDDDLGEERFGFLGGIVLAVGGDHSSFDVLDGDVLDVESNIVSGDGLLNGSVMHFDGFYFSGDSSWGEGDDHTGLDDSGLDTSHGNSSNTSDLVDILKGKSESFVLWSFRLCDGVHGFEKGLSGVFSVFSFDIPSLVPGHVGRWLDHVVTVPSGDGDEGNSLGVVSNFLDVRFNFFLDFSESRLGVWWLGVVDFVDTNDHLFDTQGVRQQSVFSGLSVLGDTGLEFTSGRGDDQNGAIGLRGSGDHVLDEITMSGGINNGDVVLLGREVHQLDVDGDTSFTLGLQFVQNPGVLEGTFSHFLGLLLELFDGSFVDTSAFVDHVSGGRGFAGVDMTDDNNVDVELVLAFGTSFFFGTHFDLFLFC